MTKCNICDKEHSNESPECYFCGSIATTRVNIENGKIVHTCIACITENKD